jgi:biopolymer transport protein ExbB/TolQ
MTLSVIEVFQSGGNFMYLILFFLCLGIAIILERLFFLYYKYNINAPKLYEQVRRTVLQGDIKRAIGLCDDSPLPAVLRAGLQQYQIKKEDVPPAMEEAILEVAPKLQRRTHYLAVVANIAVLLGLLGTIIGLIVAFSAISGAEPGEKAIQLARGISIAMATTAFGLIVAIPCLLFHAVLQSKANRLLDEIDEYSMKAAHLLQSLGRAEKEAQ